MGLVVLRKKVNIHQHTLDATFLSGSPNLLTKHASIRASPSGLTCSRFANALVAFSFNHVRVSLLHASSADM